MDDKKQNLGEEVKRRIFKKDAATQTRKETLTLTEILFSGGFNGLFIGLLMSLAVSAVKNSVLGTIVVGGSVLMIGIGVCSASYHLKSEKEIETGREMFV